MQRVTEYVQNLWLKYGQSFLAGAAVFSARSLIKIPGESYSTSIKYGFVGGLMAAINDDLSKKNSKYNDVFPQGLILTMYSYPFIKQKGPLKAVVLTGVFVASQQFSLTPLVLPALSYYALERLLFCAMLDKLYRFKSSGNQKYVSQGLWFLKYQSAPAVVAAIAGAAQFIPAFRDDVYKSLSYVYPLEFLDKFSVYAKNVTGSSALGVYYKQNHLITTFCLNAASAELLALRLFSMMKIWNVLGVVASQEGKSLKYSTVWKTSRDIILLECALNQLDQLVNFAITYSNNKYSAYLRQSFVENIAYNSSNAIILAKGNFTMNSYMYGVDTATGAYFKTIQSTASVVGKVGRLYEMALKYPAALVEISGFCLFNGAYLGVREYSFGVINELKAALHNNYTAFAKTYTHDVTNIHTVLQSGSAGFMKDKWNNDTNGIVTKEKSQVFYSYLETASYMLGIDSMLEWAIFMSSIRMVALEVIGLDDILVNFNLKKEFVRGLLVKFQNRKEISDGDVYLDSVTALYLNIEAASNVQQNIVVGVPEKGARLNKEDLDVVYDEYSEHLYGVMGVNFTRPSNERKKFLIIKDLRFVRTKGEESMWLYINYLQLHFGKIYKIAGVNGVGKSSFLSLLFYAFHNIRDTSFEVQSGQILHSKGLEMKMITQVDYLPVSGNLLEWMLGAIAATELQEWQVEAYKGQISSILDEMKFDKKDVVLDTLLAQDNLVETLSGGQKKKIQFARMFVEGCKEKVILLDEPFGPLDPVSKGIIKDMIQKKCKGSLILVVYHQDKVAQEADPFFDMELHFANNTVKQVDHTIEPPIHIAGESRLPEDVCGEL